MRARRFAPLMLSLGFGLAGLRPAAAAICDGISTAAASPLTTVKMPGTYLRPLLVTSPPGDTSRLFVVEQDGTIRIIKDGVLRGTAFLNIASITLSPADPGGDFEQGLLGLAFHPGYAANGVFYVYHTDSATGSNLLVRYTRSAADPDVADTSTRQVLFTFPHPNFGNHNGGMMGFAPDDGRLYVGTGDGGSGCDPNNNSQTLASPLGKLHRIDADAVPPTIETWAIGLRNPWRWSFDRLTSDLYIGDVGQNNWEEIDFRPAPRSPGDNFAWRVYEGTHCPNPSCAGAGACSLVPTPIQPIQEYSHASGCSVTGGYVYRGCRMPALAGRYFYADYCSAFIKSFRVVGGAVSDEITHTAELAPGGGLTINSITSFGEDARGEIYIVDGGGEVFKIVPILPSLEVSGPNAASLTLGPDWTWENLQATSDHPISQYRVYRSAGNGSGTFDCQFQSATPGWMGGDPAVPQVGSLFSYLVVARNAAGQQTSPGTGTGGTARTLSALACPL